MNQGLAFAKFVNSQSLINIIKNMNRNVLITYVMTIENLFRNQNKLMTKKIIKILKGEKE